MDAVDRQHVIERLRNEAAWQRRSKTPDEAAALAYESVARDAERMEALAPLLDRLADTCADATADYVQELQDARALAIAWRARP